MILDKDFPGNAKQPFTIKATGYTEALSAIAINCRSYAWFEGRLEGEIQYFCLSTNIIVTYPSHIYSSQSSSKT